MKSGDRVFYQGEPVWIITWLNARHREGDAWVLVEYGNGARRYVRGRDIEPDRKPALDPPDRAAERRYETWLESLKDHGP